MAPEISSGLRRLNICSRARSASLCHASHSDLDTRKKRSRNLPRALLTLPNDRLFAINALLVLWWFLSSRRPLLADSTRLFEQRRGHLRWCNTRLPACPAESPTKPRCDLLAQEWSCSWCSSIEQVPHPATFGT